MQSLSLISKQLVKVRQKITNITEKKNVFQRLCGKTVTVFLTVFLVATKSSELQLLQLQERF